MCSLEDGADEYLYLLFFCLVSFVKLDPRNLPLAGKSKKKLSEKE